MMTIFKGTCRKYLAAFLIINFLSTLWLPTISFALTGGPTSPEFSSFEPIATTNMVNDFTGDFTYNLPIINIPGAEGGGYAMSLSYHSGVTPETEASWVGLGWTLNPGAINRGKSGFPDDWDGVDVKFHNKGKKNKTATVGAGINTEAYSVDGVDVNASLRYNNFKGFGYSAGLGLQMGITSLGFNVSDGEGSFSLSVNPASLLKKKKKKAQENIKTIVDEVEKAIEDGTTEDITGLDKKAQTVKSGHKKVNMNISTSYGIQTFANQMQPTQGSRYTGKSFHASVGVLGTPTPGQFGAGADLSGTYSWQENVPSYNLSTFGYMYSDRAPEGDVLMDYHVEKESAYKKRDKFLSIPLANPDTYSLTGEGLGGGFRMYRNQNGIFRPNTIESTTPAFDLGVDIELGVNFGGGGSGAYGEHQLSVKPWENSEDFSNAESKQVDEPVFYRFNNDLGGSYLMGSENEYQGNLSNGWSNSHTVATDIDELKLQESRSGRSSYIGYNTNAEMMETFGLNSVKFRAYSKIAENYSSINRNEDALKNQIGEYSIVNEQGMRYNYGLPVFSRNEREISVDVSGIQTLDNFKVLKNINQIGNNLNSGDHTTFVGEERLTPYATTYLLTEITTPDYIDRNNDGPTNDDLGGWTKFTYDQAQGSTIKEGMDPNWYKWRMPFSGLRYQKGSLSDPDDDLGSFSSGEKEIYYLNKVVTKTHTATFFTSDRLDGLESHHNESIPSAENTSGVAPDDQLYGSNRLRRLDKIVLKENGTNKVIQTVHFEYSYELCPNTPNSDGDNLNTGGKLTLKKVWFESNGVVNAKIAPYEFEYNYPNYNYPAPYSDLSINSSAEENPNYSPHVDAWGNYQYDGESRFEKMQNWNSQKQAGVNFDPAAWNLKVIKLPSKGEIHVQYEEDEYLYVQDKRAHAMVSLKAIIDNNTLDDDVEPILGVKQFRLNLDDLNISSTDEKEKLVNLIKYQYLDPPDSEKEKMYFKFLYKLVGEDEPPTLDECTSEYISGYANVYDCFIDNGDVVVKFANMINSPLEGALLPDKICSEYVQAERAGKLAEGNCDASSEVLESDDPLTILTNFVNFLGVQIAGISCVSMNTDLSYLRVPVVNPKKGGGLRVKRILMYDAGTTLFDDQGDEEPVPVLYGSEYIYPTHDVNNANFQGGVATNEPNSIREENILIGWMQRFQQGALNKIIVGKDKRQAEGPFGESLLPGATVGYKRVVINNIHSGKTNPGFTVNEYYTAYDAPFVAEDTDIEEEHFYLPLMTGVVNSMTNYSWATQGFNFKIFNMHGRTKSNSTYVGNYDESLSDSQNMDVGALVSSTENEYFSPGESIPVLKSIQGVDQIIDKPLGTEREVVMEGKYTHDRNVNGALEMDIDAGIIAVAPFLIPQFSMWPTLSMNNTKMFSHVTSKITNYPCILKSTKSYQDGIYHHSVNTAFDENTGNPIVTKTHDSYQPLSDYQWMGDANEDHYNYGEDPNHKGVYTSYNIPATFNHSSLGQKAKNERGIVLGIDNEDNPPSILMNFNQSAETTISFSLNENVSTGDLSVCDYSGMFSAGDLIQLYTTTETDPFDRLFHVDRFEGSDMIIVPVSYSNYGSVPEPNQEVNIEILRSGRTNQLMAPSFNFTTYGTDTQSDGVFETISPEVYAERILFVNMLNDAMASGSVITSDQIPEGISFLDESGFCGPMADNLEISFDGGEFNIYNVTEVGSNIIIDGTPNNPHPMVIALNEYMEKYYLYDLDPSSNGSDLCSNNNSPLSNPNNISYELVGNSDLKVNLMRQGQTGAFNQIFNNVNGGVHAIKDYLQDDGFTLGYTETKATSTDRINLRVLIEEISTNMTFGVVYNCDLPGICFGCDGTQQVVIDKKTNTTTTIQSFPYCEKITRNNDIGQFVETTDGFLAYQYTYYENGKKLVKECKTTIQFYHTTPVYEYTSLCGLAKDDFINQYANGFFVLNEENGLIEFYTDANDCTPTPFPCLQFCDEQYPGNILRNVVGPSTVTTYSDIWDYSDEDFYLTTIDDQNDYETGRKGKWRQKSSFSYKTNITGYDNHDAASDGARTYNSGLYTLELFNFDNEYANNANTWLKLNTVTRYSPNGNAIEEENILGIKSAAKFGYDNMLPYVIGQNSNYQNLAFESFEKVYGFQFENSMPFDGAASNVINTDSHSGKHSLRLLPFNNGIKVSTIDFNDHLDQEGLLIKVWMKIQTPDEEYSETALKAEFRTMENTLIAFSEFNKVSQVGEWALYETIATPQSLIGLSVGEEYELYLRYDFMPSGTEIVLIDDVRVQPKDAQTTCYVYDVNNLRLLATYDDQHFGLYYQYNNEGKLVRKLKETERGMKTIKETQYNTPLQPRD